MIRAGTTICLLLISHLCGAAAAGDDLATARAMQARLLRCSSRVMVRAVERPDRASLDVAAWDRNPL
ncbi:MAG: hypothetical protein J7M38_05880, partial [Armatimonadetes bacterium]|nr:hypothetical protein [Armatimonadota bacterium]